MRGNSNTPVVNITDDAGAGNKEWRKAVALYGRNAMVSAGLQPTSGACKVEFIFFLARPKSTHFRSGKFSNVLKDDAPEYHTQAPDALKFARSTEDALTGIVWVDDSQTVRICSEKRWCNGEEQPGCVIRVVFI